MQASWFKFNAIIALVFATLVVGCNGTDSSSSGSSSTNASATGVWSGSDSVTGLTITALINSAGQATFIRSDGVQFVGTVQVSGTTLAVTVDGYTEFGNAFSDGSTYGIGTVNGTVSTGSSISASLTFTTNGNTSITGSWSLNYEAQSSSSTAAISGNYTDASTGAVLSITSSGVMTSQNASNSCVLNGSVSTNDTTNDIYEVAYSFGNCTGSYASLNGVQFTGLATLYTGGSAAQIIMAVTGASSSAKYSIVSTLNGS
jgi:hypothetical protein